MIQVCLAGATGWVGRPLVRAVTSADDLALKSAVSRSAAGKELEEAPGVPVFSKVAEALEAVDVLIDYTSHDAVKDHTRSALEHGVNVVIDYASSTKADVPSGTAIELAERLAETRPPTMDRALEDIAGPIEARGATVDEVQIHSLRLPSFSVSTEVILALPHERLTIRHDADSSPDPYVDGTLLAVRKVIGRVGLIRGLDSLLF